ncbi:MAG: hypothetical protein H6Q14_2164 [Bacteroidetes bacterium]|nr:hypothetical protein [Bacteroidota bacterium]
MIQDFREVMSNRTDEELIKIVTVDRNDYQTEAVDAAEKELKKRNIDETKIESVKQDIEEKETKDKEFESSIVSSGTRLIHTVVDFFGFLIIAFILSSILQLFYNPSDERTIRLVGYGLLFVSFLIYFVFMEYKFQKTLGKFITKTKVIMNDGSKPKLNEIFIRTACRLIPFDNISYLFTKNGFHDRFSNTTVIKEQKNYC